MAEEVKTRIDIKIEYRSILTYPSYWNTWLVALIFVGVISVGVGLSFGMIWHETAAWSFGIATFIAMSTFVIRDSINRVPATHMEIIQFFDKPIEPYMKPAGTSERKNEDGVVIERVKKFTQTIPSAGPGLKLYPLRFMRVWTGLRYWMGSYNIDLDTLPEEWEAQQEGEKKKHLKPILVPDSDQTLTRLDAHINYTPLNPSKLREFSVPENEGPEPPESLEHNQTIETALADAIRSQCRQLINKHTWSDVASATNEVENEVLEELTSANLVRVDHFRISKVLPPQNILDAAAQKQEEEQQQEAEMIQAKGGRDRVNVYTEAGVSSELGVLVDMAERGKLGDGFNVDNKVLTVPKGTADALATIAIAVMGALPRKSKNEEGSNDDS